MEFHVNAIRSQFPVLATKVGKAPLVYFDNGATVQKPQAVIDRIQHYYSSENANIHRGVHHLSQLSTENYEQARRTVQHFLGAEHAHEIIFTSGTTEGINLVAQSYGERLTAGDELLITQMEHHSNIVPWQLLAERKGLVLRYIPLKEDGTLDLTDLDKLLHAKTKIFAITHISNSLGTINPLASLIQKAHEVGSVVLVDAAQSLQHMRLDVQQLDCDFLVFSAHKVFGPTGTGVLYGKASLLEGMPPYKGGGDMIKTVRMEKTTFNDLPHRFEAGTPHIAGGIGLGAAITWLSELDFAAIERHENHLLAYVTERVQAIEGAVIYGRAADKSSILSFLIEGIHPYDIGTLLNQQGIAVRTGHHCTQPVMDFFAIPGTIRVSFSLYNTVEEIDRFVDALKKAIQLVKK